MGQPDFQPITLDRREEYLERFAAMPQKASDYSFANIWGWADKYGLEWSWGHSHVFIRQTKPDLIYWAPVGPWFNPDWCNCPHVRSIKRFTRVPQVLAEHWRSQFCSNIELEEARGHWDYLYSVPALIELKGNKYHKKKNHLNQFKKMYRYDYQPLTTECIEETLVMQQEWLNWREDEDSAPLLAENKAIERVLQSWDLMPGLLGGALRVEGEMIAYTVAEALTDDTLVIHFEKGKPGFRGVYQAINQMFLADTANGFSHVNREQDLGDEGLRKAKLSYQPDDFLKKYHVQVA